MTIQNENRRNDYVGNGSTDTYAYTFKIAQDADLRVVQRDTDDVESVLTLTTDYTVTGAGEPTGGNVVLVAGNLPSGYLLAIVLDPELTQKTDFRNQGDFFPETHEDAIDNGVQISKSLLAKSDRTIKIAETDGDGSVSTELPVFAADKLLKTNSGGTALELVDPGSNILQIPADNSVSTVKIQDDAVDKDKIAADVAGDGLVQNVDGSLEVNVDDSTIEINADTVRVKASGIGANELGDLNQDMLNAISGAASPAAGNVFATMNDIPELKADLFEFQIDVSGASWSVDTGALGFTPKAVFIDWDIRGSTTTYQGWGYAHGTGSSEQNGRCFGYTKDSGVGAANLQSLSAIANDANNIMGYEAVSGATMVFATAFSDEQASVTQFSSAGVIISTSSGAWASGGSARIRMLVIGQ